jgi:hypothetical protein
MAIIIDYSRYVKRRSMGYPEKEKDAIKMVPEGRVELPTKGL